MRGGVWLCGLALLVASPMVRAHEFRDLADAELGMELERNDRMAGYVTRNGMPDVAERRFLSDRPPWDKYEIILYYLGTRREISFARAYILGEPSIAIVRYERALSDADVAELGSHATHHSALDDRSVPGDPATRAEASARRAEDAAARVERAAQITERAASRAESMLAKLETVRTSRRVR